MRELVETLLAWQADGVQVGRAVVVRTYGSAPRPEGATLLYASDGRIAGSVSGGCVEADVAREIDTARMTSKTRTVSYGIADEEAWRVGLLCGGTIDVLVEPDVPVEVLAAAGRETGSVVITELPGKTATDPQPRLLFSTDGGLHGTTGEDASDAALNIAAHEALLRGRSRLVEIRGTHYFVEAFPVKPRLVIVGAGEVAKVLVTLAHELGFETIVIDGRAAYITRERFPNADQLVVGWPDEVADQISLSRDDFVAILSHDVKFDEPAIIEAFRRGCRYVGAIGSMKTQAERREKLRQQGVSEADLARLRGPIGLDLGGRAPAETALAILAEVVATRYAAAGMPLRDVVAIAPPLPAVAGVAS